MAQTRAKGSTRKDERFSTVPPTRVPRSAFDRSFSHKTTIDSGLLYPVYVDEVLPGDTVTMTPAFFARIAGPAWTPYMDGMHLDWQFFYVPFRLVWNNFVKMMGEREAPDDHNDYTVPQMVAPASTGYAVGSLSDYLTLPTEVPDYSHSSLFHRGYNLIWREWYRDGNLQDPPIVDLDDGPDDPADYVLLRRGKRKDYFSGALPFAQRGEPVEMPLGTTAPVTITGTGSPLFQNAGTAYPAGTALQDTLASGSRSVNIAPSGGGSTGGGLLTWDDPALDGLVDLSAATAATINDMRQAIAVQHLLERDARGGSNRYREVVLAHFGVQTDDIRLLRPELLATGSMMVTPTPVASQTDGSAPIGTLRAFATGQGVGRTWTKSFTEHGMIMGLCSVRADLSYQQGLNRMFSRKTRYEYYWPDLANLGEQAVLSREIYTDGTGVEIDQTGDFSVWGYQPRYEEYRHRPSVITGEFRSTYATSLDNWHLGLDFASRPVLNDAFIEENPPIDRVIIFTTAPQFLLDAYYKVRHVRPMPKFSVPGLTRF